VIYNPVAYETGNKEISNGTVDKARVTRYSKEMSNLTNDEGKRFIYAEKVYNLTTLVYFSSGLSKSIKNSTDSEYQRATQVSQNEEYSYKLTMANSAISVSKDIVLFDSLENYTTPSGETSNWKGILQSIDTTQIEKAGIKPVVYASDVALDLSTFGGLTTDEMLSKFKPISEFADYSTIKTIAIDCRKMQDGSEAELGKGKSLVSIINMKAPASLPTGVVYKNYNNVYAHVTATDSGAETTAFINNGYTINSYKVTGNMFVNKLNSDTKQGAQGVQFTLSGTSAYGEQVSMVRTSDSKGLVEFKKIPVGKYLLVETDSTPNYFLDDTKHIVEVTEQGEVLIDGQARSAITLENKPRVSANIKFTKKSYPNSVGISVPVADAEFTLQGTSDYGNDVLETSKSKDDGTVEFKNIEMGTYKLFETKAPTVYAKSTDEFKVTISSTGTVTITNVTESKNTDTVYNYRRLVPVSFKKINAETNEPIPAGKISFKLSGQDSEGRIINQELSVNWKGVVSADIPVGIYTIQENPNPTDSNGKSYLRDSREYILEVKKDGTFTLDMEKVGDDYVVKNTQIATDVITITKQWVGGNPNGYIPKIRIYTNPTDIPQN
jgi:probable cell surface protein (LPXTG motif)